MFIIASPIADIIDDNGESMIDNYQYIQEKRFQDMKQPEPSQ